MRLSSFIKPTIGKLIITLLLFIGTYLLFRGFPLIVLQLMFGGPNQVNYLYGIIDILFWYLVAIIIVSLYNKLSGK